MGGGVWEDLTGWIGHGRTDDEDATPRNVEESLVDPVEYDRETLRNRIDIIDELGVLPGVFVRNILEAEGGKLWQQDFQRYGNFSECTICRLLQDLEAEGVITRYRIGREKLVTLPGESIVPSESAKRATTTGSSSGPTGVRTGTERPPKVDD